MEMKMGAAAEAKEIVTKELVATSFKLPSFSNTRWVIHPTRLVSLSSDSLKSCLALTLYSDGKPSKEDHLMLSSKT